MSAPSGPSRETTLFARTALLPSGWTADARVTIGAEGRIAGVERGGAPAPGDLDLGGRALLPAMGNLHSHAFQRAMAGLAEHRSGGDADSFWTWRAVMYRFLAHLTPDDMEAIAAFAFMEMAEAGYAAVAEFHYLHRQPDGRAYDDPAEMAARLAAAARETGLGLTLLPVYYAYGGAGEKPLAPAQARFGATRQSYPALREAARRALAGAGADSVLGMAFHSLRAVAPGDVAALAQDCADSPVFHIHVAEQTKEVEDVSAWLGARPVAWLLDNAAVDAKWCLVHATHMSDAEAGALARSGAVAGLCPVTEANLGDGIFNAAPFLAAGGPKSGRFGVGTDSNVAIALAEELRLLEYAQRLSLRQRNVFCEDGKSTGRTLYDGALEGGAAALGREAGRIETGCWADLMTLDPAARAGLAAEGDGLLDAFVFTGGGEMGGGAVRDVWSAGRRLVEDGRHRARRAVEARYRKTLARLAPLLG